MKKKIVVLVLAVLFLSVATLAVAGGSYRRGPIEKIDVRSDIFELKSRTDSVVLDQVNIKPIVAVKPLVDLKIGQPFQGICGLKNSPEAMGTFKGVLYYDTFTAKVKDFNGRELLMDVVVDPETHIFSGTVTYGFFTAEIKGRGYMHNGMLAAFWRVKIFSFQWDGWMFGTQPVLQCLTAEAEPLE